MQRFRERLPGLMETLSGRWVVFRDGEVISVHDDEEAAFRSGLANFGRHGGHLVVQVAEQRAVPLTAAKRIGPGVGQYVSLLMHVLTSALAQSLASARVDSDMATGSTPPAMAQRRMSGDAPYQS